MKVSEKIKNDEEISYLSKRIMELPANVTNAEIIELYNRALKVLKGNKYSQEEKYYIGKYIQWESLGMLYDGIE